MDEDKVRSAIFGLGDEVLSDLVGVPRRELVASVLIGTLGHTRGLDLVSIFPFTAILTDFSKLSEGFLKAIQLMVVFVIFYTWTDLCLIFQRLVDRLKLQTFEGYLNGELYIEWFNQLLEWFSLSAAPAMTLTRSGWN